MNHEKLISVIIPVYNTEKYIGEAIQSVIDQTYKCWELIVVDDCSTDKTLEVVNAYVARDTRIKLIESSENFGGPAKPRNIGIGNASGEYIAFLDADDIWVPEKLQRQLEVFNSDSMLLAVGSNSETFPNGRSNSLFLFRNKTISFEFLLYAYKNFLSNTYIVNSGIVIKKEAFESVGLLDEDRRLIAVEDYDYWLRLLKFRNRSILILKKPLVKYRLHHSNISATYGLAEHFNRLLVMYKKHANIEGVSINRIEADFKHLLAVNQLKFAYYQGRLDIRGLIQDHSIGFRDKFVLILKRALLSLIGSLKAESGVN